MRKDHPLRPIRVMAGEVLKKLSPEFLKMYAKGAAHRKRQSQTVLTTWPPCWSFGCT